MPDIGVIRVLEDKGESLPSPLLNFALKRSARAHSELSQGDDTGSERTSSWSGVHQGSLSEVGMGGGSTIKRPIFSKQVKAQRSP